MKKASVKFALLITLFLQISPIYLAEAQTLAPATQELLPIKLVAPAIDKTLTTAAIPSVIDPAATAAATTKDPATTTTTPSATGTFVPAPLTAEAPPAPAETQQAGTTPAGTKTDSATDTKPATQTQEIIYPDAVIPILDLDDTPTQQETQETIEQCAPAATASCLDPATASAAVLPPVVGNQVKIAILVFLGATMGTLLFILSNFMLNAARGKRDILKMERQNRLAASSRRLETLGNTYKPLTDSLSRLFKPSGNRLLLDANALAEYRAAAVDIELFGSVESLKAHQKLTSMLSQTKLPPLEEIETAKSDLTTALQKDLGLGIKSTPPPLK